MKLRAWLWVVLVGCAAASEPRARTSATGESAAASIVPAAATRAQDTPPSAAARAAASEPARPQPSVRPASASGTAESGVTLSPDPAPEPAPAPESEAEAVLRLESSASTSLGAPANGTVEGAVALPLTGSGFRHNPRRPPEARYGTVELVQAIVRAAADVERELPGSGLTVNDLGLASGGPIAQHGSHQSGRDADILFYVLDADGEPLPSVGVPLDPSGEGWDFKDLHLPDDDVRVRLDAPRTWRFIQGLIEHAGRDLQRIFVVEHVRTMLLEAAERSDAPGPIVERFALVSCQPGTPHDDHMHVRFYCAPDDIGRGCVDKAPLYPWHKQALHALGVAPQLEHLLPHNKRKRSRAVAKRTTTRAQARKRAGPMHIKVRRFLDRRETWAKKPSPGRPFCR